VRDRAPQRDARVTTAPNWVAQVRADTKENPGSEGPSGRGRPGPVRLNDYGGAVVRAAETGSCVGGASALRDAFVA
jgi:hypothetical protein